MEALRLFARRSVPDGLGRALGLVGSIVRRNGDRDDLRSSETLLFVLVEDVADHVGDHLAIRLVGEVLPVGEFVEVEPRDARQVFARQSTGTVARRPSSGSARRAQLRQLHRGAFERPSDRRREPLGAARDPPDHPAG